MIKVTEETYSRAFVTGFSSRAEKIIVRVLQNSASDPVCIVEGRARKTINFHAFSGQAMSGGVRIRLKSRMGSLLLDNGTVLEGKVKRWSGHGVAGAVVVQPASVSKNMFIERLKERRGSKMDENKENSNNEIVPFIASARNRLAHKVLLFTKFMANKFSAGEVFPPEDEIEIIQFRQKSVDEQKTEIKGLKEQLYRLG